MRVTEQEAARLLGQPKRRAPARLHASEQQEQEALMEFCQRVAGRLPELALLFHIPNGGLRDPATAIQLQRAGVKPGVPDLLLPVARRGFHGLWIELKAQGGKASEEQLEWAHLLRCQDFQWVLCVGWAQAARVLVWYLGAKAEDYGL